MRIYLASTSNGMRAIDREAAIVRHKPKYLLEAFIEGETDCKRALDATTNEYFLLDSGAFSYMNSKAIDLKGMEAYMERYIAFINQHRIQYFFEMDVESIFGMPQVEEWRRKLERETGRQCIPVWHKQRGIDYWRRMCEEYSYISVGGFNFDIRPQEYDLIKRMVSYAAARGVKVHGLGFTKTSILKQFGFYSVDSTTWLVGAIRGRLLYSYANGKLTMRRIENNGRKADQSLLAVHNMGEWIKYQYYMDFWRNQ